MNILIDIGHPAHVHLFKNFAWRMQEKGHTLLFTCREKEFEIDLLNSYNLLYKSFGIKKSSRAGKIFGLFEFDIKEVMTGLGFKPDVFVSHGSIYAAHAAFLLRKPHISLEDTFNFEQIRLYLPFTAAVLTGDYAHPSLGKKEIKYAGYHELAYLHPNYFFSDESVLDLLGVNKNQKYIIIRFVAWKATHDYGHQGITYLNKLKAIEQFEKYAKVFVSSEAELSPELQPFQLHIPPDKLHDALAFASVIWAESFTIPAECSVLGVPSVVNHNTKSYYLSEQEERYKLCFIYSESENNQIGAIERCIQLLQEDTKTEWQKRRDRMLAYKIDVTAFLVWFVENYPDSAQIMRKDPDYQWRFK